MAEAPRFNLRNPAVKRIMQEIKEIKQDTSGDFLAEALETDIFEWHFVIRGPQDTEFDGGIYHGRILLPAEYPFKPPSFMMLTPNGRFETNVKICLSISSHHPEHWQPSWSVRTALMALIAFMPSPGAGALGALDFSKDERRVLAARSRVEPPRFGSAERQRVIDEMHARMLAIAGAKQAERQAMLEAWEKALEAARQQDEGRATSDNGSGSQAGTAAADQPPAQAAVASAQNVSSQPAASTGLPNGEVGAGTQRAPPEAVRDGSQGGPAVDTAAAGPASAPGAATASSSAPAAAAVSLSAPLQQALPGSTESTPAAGGTNAATTAATPVQPAAPAALRQTPPAAPSSAPASSSLPPAVRRDTPVTAAPHRAPTAGGTVAAAAAAAAGGTTATSADHMLTALMWFLYVGIGAILLRKVMGAMGVDLAELMQQYQ